MKRLNQIFSHDINDERGTTDDVRVKVSISNHHLERPFFLYVIDFHLPLMLDVYSSVRLLTYVTLVRTRLRADRQRNKI